MKITAERITATDLEVNIYGVPVFGVSLNCILIAGTRRALMAIPSLWSALSLLARTTSSKRTARGIMRFCLQ
jgi:hypothetical protein